MTEREELIGKALELIEQASQTDERCPAAVVMLAPDQGAFLRGNQEGFVKLAEASLRASLREGQKFGKDTPWFVAEDLDWTMAGLEFDESAHIYLPPKRTRWQELRSRMLGYIVLICFLLLLVVGFVVTGEWVGRFISRLLH